MINNLIKLGLSERQAKIYMSIAKNGPSRVVDIYKMTKIHRTTIEKNLIELVKYKLLSKIKTNKIDLFDITDPIVLTQIVDKKIEESKKLVVDINKKFKPQSDEIKVEIFKGINGMYRYNKKIIDYTPKNSTIYYLFTSEKRLMPFNKTKDFHLEYEKARVEKNITRHVIFGHKFLYKKTKKVYKEYFANTKAKVIPTQGSLISFFLFPDHVGFEMMFNEPYVLCIRSKKLYNSYKNIFDNVWKTAKEED